MNPKHSFFKTLSSFLLLALALSVLGDIPVRAAQVMPEAIPPAGLSATDWAQIHALLGTVLPSQQAYLKASNTEAYDDFGWSVAVSGNTVVVGAFGESSNATGVNGNQNDNSADSAGAAYVFVRSGGTWSQQAYLKASNTEMVDDFGISVAISGDTVVVGAYYEASNATGVNGDQSDNSAVESGAAYIFVRSGTTWSQQAYLKASNTDGGDLFGYVVAVSGDTVVVGSPFEESNATGVNGNQNDNSALYSGAAYVFTRSGTTWSQEAYLKASNTEAYDDFGTSVAISGDTVVVGADLEGSNAIGVNGNQNDNSAGGSGAVYVFTRSSTTWNQQAYLKASNTEADDNFGHSVAISGDTVVVGTHYEDSNATGVDGIQNDNSATDSGAAYVFTRDGATWSQQAYLKASNTEAGDYFGWSVAIDGDMVVVGANYEDSNATGVNGNQTNNSASGSGAAYVFTRSGTTWSKQAYLKASNPEAWDYFGISVAVSGDTLVIGAYYEDSNATGVNGNQNDNSATSSGSAYIYVYVPNSAPTNINLSNSSVDENQPIETTVGTLTTTDLNIGDTHTYSFACSTPGMDDASFRIRGDSLQTNAVFDYETKNNYAICIRTDDAMGGTFDKDFTINVIDLIEANSTFLSVGTYDGWILESTETSIKGGTLNAVDTSFRLGDEMGDKQYRAILSFNTAGLPDNAVITKVTLKIKKMGQVGTNPFTILTGLKADIRKPFFGTTAGLMISDFQAAVSRAAVGTFGKIPVSNWYSAIIGSAGYPYVNKTGTTQFRLYFLKDDNDDNGADYMKFYSGNYATTSARPTLIIEYYVP